MDRFCCWYSWLLFLSVGGSGNSPPTSEYKPFTPQQQQQQQQQQSASIYQQQQKIYQHQPPPPPSTQIYQQQTAAGKIYQQQQQTAAGKIYQQQPQQPAKTYGLPVTNTQVSLLTALRQISPLLPLDLEIN